MSKENEIDSEIRSIYQILVSETSTYFIPDFQRSFVWNEKDVKQLLDDMAEDAGNYKGDTKNLVGYLLGTVVLIFDRENNRYIVVDGQQRLTTLTLIALAIEKVIAFKEYKDNIWTQRSANARQAYCVINEDYEFERAHIEHDAHLHFGQYYGKLIRGEATENDIEKEEDSNIQEVYNTIQEHLEELDKQQLAHFVSYFFYCVKLIVTIAPSEAKAFQLFEILNDRGRSLEPMDLIKNTFLKGLAQANKDDKEFNINWDNIMNHLQIDKKKKISSSTFLKYYLLSVTGINVKAEKLFNHFKEKPMSADEILQFVDGMAKSSKIYAQIEKGNYSAYNNDDNMGLLFKVLGIRQFHPMLMPFYYDESDIKSEILDLVTRLGASILFSYTQTNKIESLVPELLVKYLDTQKNDAALAYKNLVESIELEIEKYSNQVKSLMPSKNHVSTSGNVNTKAGAILKFIEVYFNRNKEDVILGGSNRRKASVEHILSQKLDFKEEGISYKDLKFKSDDERKNYLHRIGNLTLIDITENSSMQNSNFKNKKKYYEESDYIMTSTIVKAKSKRVKSGQYAELCDKINKYEKQYNPRGNHWTKEMIDKRGQDLTELICKMLTKQV